MSAADDIARMKAEVDQAKEGLKELAGAVHAFYTALEEEGFKPDQALIITVQWMTTLLGGARGGTDT